MTDLPGVDQPTLDLPGPDVWTCGNAKLEGTEQCDGSVPKGKTCKTLGFTHGVLGCDNKTCKLVTTGCMKVWPLGSDGPLRLGSKHGPTKLAGGREGLLRGDHRE